MWLADFDAERPATHKWCNEPLQYKPPREFFRTKSDGVDVMLSCEAYTLVPGLDPEGPYDGPGAYNPRSECKLYCSKDVRVLAMS
eukprot:3337639-Prymnesium_polylepis.1